MNVTLPNEKAIKKKQMIIYVLIILFCVISIIIAFYVQFYARIDFGKMLGISANQEGSFGNKTQEQILDLETNFDKIFTNNIENDNGENDAKKIDANNNLVYTKYEKKEIKQNSYDLEIRIPTINIDNEIISKYNEEIEETYARNALNVLNSQNRNIIFTVEYTANVYNGILSLIIRSNLKEGSNAQRVIIQTYNYDLRNNKEISLEEVLAIEHLDKENVQNRIKTKIEEEQKRADELNKLGYTIYTRDVQNDMYKIENTQEFYLTNDTLYIIYPYGNESETSETDLIVL
mgnify:FL=1